VAADPPARQRPEVVWTAPTPVDLLLDRLRRLAYVHDDPYLGGLLARSPEFLRLLVEGLEWTRLYAKGFGRPRVSLGCDEEEGTEYIGVEFPVSLPWQEASEVSERLSRHWGARAWQAAPCELRLTERLV